MAESISFDRAADWYDATRVLAAPVRERITEALLRELERAGAGRLLEVGAGTGRMSRPLAAAGVRVTGLDISPRMLERFRDQVPPGAVEPDLLLGDATQLPFRSRSFRAVLTVHVLHLISDWKQAVRELRRVLEDGGIVLRQAEENDFEAREEHRESDAAWRAILARRGFVPRQRAGIEETNRYARELGGAVRSLELCEGSHVRSERGFIQTLRWRVHSNTWEIPDGVYWPSVDEYEAWASERFGDLDRAVEVRERYLLDVWTFPDRRPT